MQEIKSHAPDGKKIMPGEETDTTPGESGILSCINRSISYHEKQIMNGL
jgi:hypothetical protein